MTRFALLTALAAALAAPCLASAQSVDDYFNGFDGGIVGGGFDNRYHSSTIQESVLRGTADLTRAVGRARLESAIALRHYEEARARDLENRVKTVETYFELRRINEQARQEKYADRPDGDDAARLAKLKAPGRLQEHEFEPALGRLYWPAALSTGQFTDTASQIDAIFYEVTHGERSYTPLLRTHLNSLVSQLEGELVSQVDAIPTTDYVAARSFLKRLKYETRYLPTLERVAAR